MVLDDNALIDAVVVEGLGMRPRAERGAAWLAVEFDVEEGDGRRIPFFAFAGDLALAGWGHARR